jgi:hypothetical protein
MQHVPVSRQDHDPKPPRQDLEEKLDGIKADWNRMAEQSKKIDPGFAEACHKMVAGWLEINSSTFLKWDALTQKGQSGLLELLDIAKHKLEEYRLGISGLADPFGTLVRSKAAIDNESTS